MLSTVDVTDIGVFGVGFGVFPQLLHLHVLVALKAGQVSNDLFPLGIRLTDRVGFC
jgi:hypothetical protein